ncbi:uncharacterized protein LOC122856563 [Aphidius gifuensis]|uniref:uncharacterized protein LOC122856563 n=1 Tax=Aphidius gifuensis TaxID=684658 RepID=UPI001CDBB6A7|nr:uncharacterized protein LOC122856563 [Aphidius gifuensis]
MFFVLFFFLIFTEKITCRQTFDRENQTTIDPFKSNIKRELQENFFKLESLYNTSKIILRTNHNDYLSNTKLFWKSYKIKYLNNDSLDKNLSDVNGLDAHVLCSIATKYESTIAFRLFKQNISECLTKEMNTLNENYIKGRTLINYLLKLVKSSSDDLPNVFIQNVISNFKNDTTMINENWNSLILISRINLQICADTSNSNFNQTLKDKRDSMDACFISPDLNIFSQRFV